MASHYSNISLQKQTMDRNMKYLAMQIAALPLFGICKLIFVFKRYWNRIWWTTCLDAQGALMDYSVQCDGYVRVLGTGRVTLGPACRLGRDVEFETGEQGRIVLGSRVRINRGTTLASQSEIRIGDDVMLGEFVSVRDANHGTEPGRLMRLQPQTSDPILIENDVWVGRGTCILPGVLIGEGAVIGANSVVSRDIPPYAIAVGAPARVVRLRCQNNPNTPTLKVTHE